jgi:annexin A7/11
MKSALLYIVHRAESDDQGIQATADLLESSMAGMGTKDERLIWRVVRSHWNRSRFEAVKLAYQRTYGKTLRKRVEGETTGKYEVSPWVRVGWCYKERR